ncbi:MAG: hypothetical protein JXN59_14070 [Anaerolineae bacterium]|nr:hypothetical protein [Anaerolineae bacterium]
MMRRMMRTGLLVLFLLANGGGVSQVQAQAGGPIIHLAGETAALPDVQVQLTSEPLNNPGTDLQTEELYRGPVTFSVVYGQSLDLYNEINPSSSPVTNRLTVERNGTAQSVQQSNNHSVRLFLHLAWPGIDQAETHIQELAKKGRFSRVHLIGVAFQMFLEADDGYFGEIRHYAFDTVHGGWVRGNLPDGVQQIWVQPVQRANENQISGPPIAGKWQVNLYDVTPKRGRILSNDCPATSCMPGDFLTQLNGQVKAGEIIPVMCPDQAANGILIQKSWIETRTIWWDFTRQLGFEPAPNFSGQEWLIIAISAETAPQSFSIVFPNSSDGIYHLFPLSLSSLYGERSKAVILDNALPTLRSIEQGFVLQGLIPQGVSMQEALLVQTPYGPVWRLSCAGN